MAAGNDEATIVIIKKVKKVVGGGHHGGAWKVAYADFVTAMMAFFLVMWLINATSETTKTGVANYFNPIKLANGTQLLRAAESGDNRERNGSMSGHGHVSDEVRRGGGVNAWRPGRAGRRRNRGRAAPPRNRGRPRRH